MFSVGIKREYWGKNGLISKWLIVTSSLVKGSSKTIKCLEC